MVSKLRFKGSTGNKKRKNVHRDGNDDDSSVASKRLVKTEEQDGQQDMSLWTTAQDFNDLNGPCMFILSTDPPSCFGCDGNGKLYISRKFHLPGQSEDGMNKSELDKDAVEPDSVQQVFIISQLPISTTSGGSEGKKYAIKTHDGQHYLSADEYGFLEATSQAVGPDEQFRFKPQSPGFAIESIHNRFISFLEGQQDTSLRADSETAGLKETLTIRVQSKFRKKPDAESKVPGAGTRISETISRAKLQEMVGGGQTLDSETVRELKRAWKEGRINEALLDVRTKMKTDHRC